MKLFLALTLAVAVVNAGFGFEEDFEKLAIKKWTGFKAMESCVGVEVSNMFIAKKKEAFATCFGRPAPEVFLPMFKNTEKTAAALASFSSSSKMEDTVDEPTMDQMFKKYLFEKAFKDMMENEEQQMSGMKFFKSRFQNRFRRDAEEMKGDMKADMKVDMKEMALSEKLNEKLKAEKSIADAFASNFTCMAQQCGTLDAAGKFASLEDILKKFDAIKLPTEGLKEAFTKDATLCYKITTALPAEVLTECQLGPELYKVNYFKRCLTDRKLKTCMDFDLKARIEKSFGPMAKMEEMTQLKEKDLIPLVRKLMHGDDM